MFKCFLPSCCIWYLVSAHDHKFSHCAAANVSGGGADSMTTNFPYVQPTMECGDHHKIDQSFSPGQCWQCSGRHLHCGMDSVSRWSGLRGMGVVQSSSILFLLHNIQIHLNCVSITLRCHAI